MATRFTAKPVSNFGVPPLETGFDNVSVPNNLVIPSVGIEDVDVAIFNLFNEEINLSVIEKTGVKRVPVIFASGEKWAMLKKGRALRDKQGSLILPLITVGRTNIQQLPGEDTTGRGINQQTGDLVIKRRLDRNDRAYQSLINRLLIKNQDNIAVNPTDDPTPTQLTTERTVGELQDDPTYSDGGLLASDRLNNVWEVITVPAPQFFTATYDVEVWVQYTAHMNQVMEGLMTSFLPQGNAWRLETKKGYWFVATVDGNLYSAENNYDDMSQEERIIKYKFSVKVPAYILASKTPGAPVPIRRYVSNPEISFKIAEGGSLSSTSDPYMGADDPTLPLSITNSRRRDQREDGSSRLYSDGSRDPALTTLNRGEQPAQYQKIQGVDRKGRPVTKYARIKSVNRFNGESVLTATDLSDLALIVADD